MRKYFKLFLYLIVFNVFNSANAGAYEDFFRAIGLDDEATVTSLLKRGFDPNTVNPQGLPGLYLALREPAPKVAEVLLQSPAIKVESRTPQDESPLMMAALRGQLALARKLIARDADVNKPGWAPLHYAASQADAALIALMLEHHAYIDAESPNGTTPLMMAAKYGSPAGVRLLLDSGADATLKNQLGLTALDFANQGSRPDAVEMLSAWARVNPPKGR